MKRITRVFSSILLALPLVATSCGGGKQLYGPDPYSCGAEKDSNQYCKDNYGEEWVCVDGTCVKEQAALYGPNPIVCAGKANADQYCKDTFGKEWVCVKGERASADSNSDASSDAASDNS
jgi:hypothetical protein